ncbi:sugar isomerase domain-containing protein [Glycomyces artemisiae]|uniref:Putative phosphosugar-binding protein n=1 Tax=Glycomyces artemisiae TaxID=1076443 RepID=A0A2T0UA44_9ACTN|nr:SIS domain-containing protein [Glycomyces artemisiae]PRY54738.1 putative phosphosugar-binding protein [Glycomyces artemisiae]
MTIEPAPARITGAAYLDLATETIRRVGERQADAVVEAARLIADSISAGGVLQAFGSGHSEALAMELAGRAGGLVPSNKIALRDLVLAGGEPLDVLADPFLERDPDVARRLLETVPTGPADVFAVASNSGINGVVVELALLVKDKGHPLIAFTSAEHSAKTPSRHPSGKRLSEIADVVLDNGAPYGDAAMPLPGGGAVGAVSSVTSAVLAQMVVGEAVQRLIDAGHTPPVYLSANIPGGDDHNLALEARYAGRIRRTA